MTPWWHTRQWRLIQTNLREIDMRDIRAAQVVADLQSFQANVLMINAAGIIASYPTRLPFHYQSPYLTGDSLQDILAACHQVGIRVFARCDFSKIRRPIYEQHPDWAYIGVDSEPVDYNGDVHVCVNSPYQQVHMLEIIEEMLSSHPFDGIFFNFSGFYTHDYSGTDHGPCQCQNCRRKFREHFHLDLPLKANPADAGWRAYEQFKRHVLHDHEQRVYRFIHTRWPQVCIANHLEENHGFIRQEANTALDRPLPVWQYSASENTRWAVGSHPQMVSSSTSVDFIDFPYRHVAVSPHQQALRLAQNLANNGALDYYLIGRLDNHADRSGFAPVKDLFHFHAAHETEFTGLTSQAEIALLKPASGSEEEYRGWFRVLAENHFLFDVLTVQSAGQRPLDAYKALILPGMERVAKSLAQRLDRFVSSGGRLIASGKTAFCNESGEPHPRPALACLGIQEVTAIREDTRSSYLRLTQPAAFPRLAETDLVYLDGAYVYAEYASSARLEMRLIPPHPFGPPERCYYTQETAHPGFVNHKFGKGEAFYIPWYPGTQFYRHGHTNTVAFLADLLQQAGGLHPVGGNLPPAVEVTCHASPDRSRRIVFLVNASGHFGNSFYAPLPLRDGEFLVQCPSQPRSVQALRLGQDCSFTWSEGELAVRLPALNLIEAIKIAC